MAGKRPAKTFRNYNSRRAYTRRKYMGGVPGNKIVHYDMGNLKGEFPVKISLVADEACQVRDGALEAGRITANRLLVKMLGVQNFHMKLRVHPFQVIRENKQATGAGADRVSQGMRQAFGKAVGLTARVKQGQKIFTISTDKEGFLTAKDALRRCGHKLSTTVRIVVDEGQELVN
ncbi:MAG: 50S ribosomal protein L16 [ANME-2 cluster archaeon]|nr:50S ribosomal protein L16 [ANME-2 cluster archaeon]MDF1557441.1 50S ribosomal protein L16 [ANME-2 cluster archaeon]